MISSQRFLRFSFLMQTISLSLVLGCNSESTGPARFELSGEVTYQGKPVPYGEMIFAPDTSAGNSGPGAFAEIREGRYTLPQEKGIVGGAHIITISGFTAPPAETAVPEPGTPVSKPLFTAVDLKKTLPNQNGVQNFVVPAD